MPKATKDWNEDLQGMQSNANCVKLTRGTAVMFFPDENQATWVMEAIKQRMERQGIDHKMFKWEIEPWLIEGEF